MRCIHVWAVVAAILASLPAVAIAEDLTPSEGEALGPVWERVTAVPKPEKLPLAKVIRAGAILSADGDAVYCYRHREQVDFSNRYDFVHEDLATGKAKVLTNAGSDNYFLFRWRDLVFGSSSVEDYETHRPFAFSGSEPRRHPGSLHVVGEFVIANGHFVYGDGDGLKLLREDGSSKLLLASKKIRNLWFGYPDRNAFLVDEGEDTSDAVFSYVQFEPDTGKATRKELLRASKARRYARVCPWTKNRILLWEAWDSNEDGVADYKDWKNEQIRSCDLSTGRVETVIERKMELAHVVTHPSGLILFAEHPGPEETDRTVISFHNPDTGKSHRAVDMDAELRFFTLDRAWTKLVFFRLTDTNGDGKVYYWEDEGEGFVVNLKRK